GRQLYREVIGPEGVRQRQIAPVVNCAVVCSRIDPADCLRQSFKLDVGTGGGTKQGVRHAQRAWRWAWTAGEAAAHGKFSVVRNWGGARVGAGIWIYFFSGALWFDCISFALQCDG